VVAVMAVAAMMATIAGASGVASVGGGGGMTAMIAGHLKDEGTLDGKPAQPAAWNGNCALQ